MNVAGYVISYNSNKADALIEKRIQREKMLQFCEQNRLEFVKLYTEQDITEEGTRPSLVALMDSAVEKNISGILVYSYDRLALEEDIRNWIIQEFKNYGIEVYSLTEVAPLSPSQKAGKKSKTIQEKLRDLPSLPEIVTKVTELVQDPKSSAAQISRIISHDSGLTSRVLKMVNSAYYGFPRQISSIQHAIAIMGFTTMKSLVLSSSIFRIFTPKAKGDSSLNYKNFWKHSLLTAIASKEVYYRLFFENDENIFSAAILHDIGKIILDQYDHENYSHALKEIKDYITFGTSVENSVAIVLETEKKHCDVSHPFIGHFVSEAWNLPESISEVILYHHNPLESKKYQKLSSAVYLGNIISHLILDLGVFSINAFSPEVLSHLGLDEYTLAEIFSNLKQEAEKLQDLESFFK